FEEGDRKMPKVIAVQHELLEQVVLAAVRARPTVLQKSNLVQMLVAIGIHKVDAQRIVEDFERRGAISRGTITGTYIV
ncbi:MAG: hypothetical protein AAB908_00355, partial [Patescibacteria group bacterium]